MERKPKRAVLSLMSGVLPSFIRAGLILFCFAAYTRANEAPYPEFQVMGVNQAISMDGSEPSQKDFFVSGGSDHGLYAGQEVRVFRKIPVFDLLEQRLFREMLVPFAKMKITYVDRLASIAKVTEIFPGTKTAALSPRAVQVGDIVRVNSSY